MRVISGSARGHTLAIGSGCDTRPTSDRAKEGLFSVLAPILRGATFLDLFCGSGAIGIEALSRGAESAVFVDNSRKAISALCANLSKTRMDSKSKVMHMSADKAIDLLARDGWRFDVVFMDPPYDSAWIQSTLPAIASSPILKEDGCIITESDSQSDPMETSGLVVDKQKKYGAARFTFYRRG